MRGLWKWLGGILAFAILAAAALWFFLFRPPPPGIPAAPVTIVSGSVRGLEERGITVYRGIPYAAAPVGNLRWREPQAVAPWSGARDAFAFSKACPQIGGAMQGAPPEPQSEDCLYLNIWTPTSRNNAPLPVIVWIHGGSNTNGSASFAPYRGRQLAERGVTFVSINYRLGALGYLAHPELGKESGRGASGNYGMMDIVAALRWVQANIRAFGGDPNNVTVMGHSAGARNISHLQVSPLAAGLFHRVIAMSGANFAPSGTIQGDALLRDAEAAGMRFAEELGAKSLAELRALPVERFVQAPKNRWRGQPSLDGTLAIVDGYVVPSAPYDRHVAGRAAKVDLLLGYTSEEGINSPDPPASAEAYRTDLRRVYGSSADGFLAEYPAENDAQALASWRRLTGEAVHKWPMTEWARIEAARSSARVYLYRFSHMPGIGPFRGRGAAHGAEINYVFDFPKRGMRYGTQLPWNAAKDIALIDTIQAYWVNFARTGDPNGPGLPRWPRFDAGRAVQELAVPVGTRTWPDGREHALMDAYIASLRRQRATASRQRPESHLGVSLDRADRRL